MLHHATQSQRELFDVNSFRCLSYLESNKEFDSLEFYTSEGLKTNHFLMWQSKNQLYKLPDDLKRFYSLFNGLSIPWKVNLGGTKLVTIGLLSLNKLEDFKPISVDGRIIPSEWLGSTIHISNYDGCGAFVIDSNCEVGDIVLLYSSIVEKDQITEPSSLSSSSIRDILRGGESNPSVWLVDSSKDWHFICSSFSDYLHLMFAHVGIIGWQEVYTSYGLSSITTQWMTVFCKERLCVDLYHD